jgi:aldehyde dehydrogenase (NAD+)
MPAGSKERKSGHDVIESLNPATNEVIGTVAVQTEGQVKAAVTRAREAAELWGSLSHEQRRGELIQWRRNLAMHAEELAELIHQETGKPRADAMSEVFVSLGHLHHAALRAGKALRSRSVPSGIMANIKASISYHPLGVVGVIGPWNYPMFTPFGSIASALAAGNAVVFKPSELTPLVGQRFVELAQESITIPDVLQVVTGAGATGAALARADIDKLAFTGSARTGRRVMAAAAEHLTPVLLELGGKDAMIVCADADIKRAAHDAVYGSLTNAGQACISVERCYVVASAYDEFLAEVLALCKELSWGEQIGPITLPSQVGLIREHLEDAVAKGASVLLGGPEGIRDNFVPVTVLTEVSEEMKVMTDETFGPVLPIAKVVDVEEAVLRANETSYGLGSAIFAKAGARDLADRIRAGMTSINSVMSFSMIPSLPFGGIGESGFGRIHGDEGIREFARTKATAEERFSLPMNMMSMKLPEGTYERLSGAAKQLYGGGFVDKVRQKFHR